MGSQREHLKIVRPKDPLLIEPEFELDDYYYLFVFRQLSLSRRYEQGIPTNIPLNAYLDYQTLFEDKLHLLEILLIQRLDTMYLNKVIEVHNG